MKKQIAMCHPEGRDSFVGVVLSVDRNGDLVVFNITSELTVTLKDYEVEEPTVNDAEDLDSYFGIY